MAYYASETRHGQASNDSSKSTTLEAIASLTNSQESSLNDFSNSQVSQIRPGSSSLHEPSQGIMTPSTTLSNRSSQERIGMGDANGTDYHRASYGLEAHEGLESTSARPSEYQGNYTSAPKRTASGEIKSPICSLPTSPVDPSHLGHSRNSSMTSRGSQIGELSTQMKTRLSYAMVKVQHGWQSHNISELEHLTSNQGSPLSAGSDQQRRPAYPVPNGPPADHQQFVQPSAHISKCSSTSPQRTATTPTHGQYPKEASNYEPSISQTGSSYESFWREHEDSRVANAIKARNPPIGGPSLAPPVDIVPRNPRRLDTSMRQPPSLFTTNLHSPNRHMGPKTPSPKKPSKLRTPSQQAAVEKDVVESLLFMSSPGNSDYRPHTAPSGTPSMSEIAHHASQTSYPSASVRDAAKIHSGQPSYPVSNSQSLSRSRRPLSDAEINKMLDEMPETSSSDDEEPHDQRPLQMPLVK